MDRVGIGVVCVITDWKFIPILIRSVETMNVSQCTGSIGVGTQVYGLIFTCFMGDFDMACQRLQQLNDVRYSKRAHKPI